MHVQSYLFFDGRCEEAIEFYKKALGAKVEMMMRFSENPEPPPASSSASNASGCGPGDPSKIMHACLRIGDTAVMASDGMANGTPEFKGFSLSINAKDEVEAQRLFGALSEGGQVYQPLTKTFFSPCFGMVSDKFGVGWMVIVEQAMAKAA
jgi:PhnB protein